MNIGTPSQKTTVHMSQDSFCFEFKPSEINSNNNYYPNKCCFKFYERKTTDG